MPGYLTNTGVNTSTVGMGAGTSLYRHLCTVGSGFTITGWQLSLFYGGEANAAGTGLPAATPWPVLPLQFGFSFGATTWAPPALDGNEDASSLLWYSDGEETNQVIIVPASTTWQFQYAYRRLVQGRTQFRTTSSTDFGLQIANVGSGTESFGFTATGRIFYA